MHLRGLGPEQWNTELGKHVRSQGIINMLRRTVENEVQMSILTNEMKCGNTLNFQSLKRMFFLY